MRLGLNIEVIIAGPWISSHVCDLQNALHLCQLFFLVSPLPGYLPCVQHGAGWPESSPAGPAQVRSLPSGTCRCPAPWQKHKHARKPPLCTHRGCSHLSSSSSSAPTTRRLLRLQWFSPNALLLQHPARHPPASEMTEGGEEQTNALTPP